MNSMDDRKHGNHRNAYYNPIYNINPQQKRMVVKQFSPATQEDMKYIEEQRRRIREQEDRIACLQRLLEDFC
jgi:hypothetical protein